MGRMLFFATLTWVSLSGLCQPEDPPVLVSAPDNGAPATRNAPREINLWDQISNPGLDTTLSEDATDLCTGCSSGACEDPPSCTSGTDSETADDFVIPENECWVVQEVELPGAYYFYGLPINPLPSGVHVRIYGNSSGVPDNSDIVATRLDSAILVDDDGDLTVTLSPAIQLDAGHYWLGIQLAMDFCADPEYCCESVANCSGYRGLWRWTNRNAVFDTTFESVYRNPSGSVSSCTTWTPRSSCATASEKDQLFALNGTRTQLSASDNGPLCSGNTLELTSTYTLQSRDSRATTYEWSGPNGFYSTDANPTLSSITTAAAGVYTVVALDDNGCESSAFTTVVVNATPATPAPSNNGPICAGNDLELYGPTVSGATYAWTRTQDGWTSAQQFPVITNAAASDSDTYSLVITVNGCPSAAGSTTAVVNAVPGTPTVASNTPVCTGQMLELYGPTVVGASYAWSGPNGFSSSLEDPTIPDVTEGAEGSYSLTVTVNGCTSPAGTTAVVVNATPGAPTPASNSPVCTQDTLELTGPAGYSNYAWSGPDGFTSDVQNPSRASVTLAHDGIYSLVVTSAEGCDSPAGTVDVTVNPTPATPTPTSNSPVCDGQTLRLYGPAGYSGYHWTGPDSFESFVQNPTLAGAAEANEGSYDLVVTQDGCDSAAGSVAVTVGAGTGPNVPSISSTPSAPVDLCVGDSLALTTDTYTEYLWVGPQGQNFTTQTVNIASVTENHHGTWSLTVSNGTCTSDPAELNVSVNPATPVAGNDGPGCVGDDVQLTYSGPAGTFAWTGPNAFTSSDSEPLLSSVGLSDAGTYEVTVTSAGCTSEAGSTVVVVHANPTATATHNGPLCAGDTLQLSGSPGGMASYTWTRSVDAWTSSQQNPTLPSVDTNDSAEYTLMVENANGCTDSDTVSVSVFPLPATPTPTYDTPLCDGETLSLHGPDGFDAYQWTGPAGYVSSTQHAQRAAVIDGVHDGDYHLVVTQNGCESSPGTVNVVIHPIPEVTAQNDGPGCVGGQIQLSATGPVGASYSWTGPNSFTSTQQNPLLEALTLSDAGTYQVVGTALGCPSEPASTSVTVESPATISANSNSPVCIDASIVLSASGPSSGTYTWNGPAGFNAVGQVVTRDPAQLTHSGTYQVQHTSAGGCESNVALVDVRVRDFFVEAPPSFPLGLGTSYNLYATYNCGLGLIQVEWFDEDAGGSFIAEKNPLVLGTDTPLPATDHLFRVDATENGGSGSTATDTFWVLVDPTGLGQDFNGDLSNSMADLTQALQHWSVQPPFFDANGDGVCNILDLMYINTGNP